MERWMTISDCPSYMISNEGQVKNMNTEKVLKHSKSNGYHYVQLTVNRKRKTKYIHRLVFEHFSGKGLGSLEIDHRNGDRSDNKLSNLRPATRKQNIWNRPAKGYYWNTTNKAWLTRIMVDGVNKFIGYFKTEEEAHQAYLEAVKKYRNEFSDRVLAQ